METHNPSNWSELPLDILKSLFESLSFIDFYRAKMVCSNWYFVSKQTIPRKSGSPWLTLFLDGGGCLLYNTEDDEIDAKLREFSGFRFLANYGKWFLVLDSRSKLYIIDVFSQNRIDLPPLESLRSSNCTLKSVGGSEFRWELTDGSVFKMFGHDLKGRLWVDEKSKEFVVVWFFDSPASYLCFCKRGNDHYTVIPLRNDIQVPKLLTGLSGLVIRGYNLYISTSRRFVRVIDLSEEEGFKDVTGSNICQMYSPLGYTPNFSIAVTIAGEVLLVESTTFESHRSFQIHKKDPNADPHNDTADLLEVDSLGDEALLLDLGITVPANPTLGIKPNSIYFTRHDRVRFGVPIDHAPFPSTYDLDICVFNLATKNLERFTAVTNMELKDARWLLPMT